MANCSESEKFERELCVNSLRSVLKQLRSASLPELSRITGIASPDIDEYVRELCLEGEFAEDDALGSEETGEREVYYAFNGQHKLVLSICVLEKNRVTAAVSDLYGEYLDKKEIAESPETLEFFERIIAGYRAKYPAISLIAFGMAGFEVRGSGRVMAINFPDLAWVNFHDHFLGKFGIPCILEDDVRAACAGFYQTNNFEEGKVVAALYVPQTHHPSAGICIDGKIYRGRDNAAGELAFVDEGIKLDDFLTIDYDFSKINIEKMLVRMALQNIVVLNPDCLVVYGSALPADTAERLPARLREILPGEFLPDIRFVPDIVPDFLDGLTCIALRELEPKIDIG